MPPVTAEYVMGELLPFVDTYHLLSNKFATGGKIKVTGELILYNSPEVSLLFHRLQRMPLDFCMALQGVVLVMSYCPRILPHPCTPPG